MSKSYVAIIDYGAGNLFSVIQAIKKIGLTPKVTSSPEEIMSSKAVVLPGVGAFGEAIEKIREQKIDEAILEVVNEGKPFLGICLGMQLLFSSSCEFGEYEGLGIIPGEIKKFPVTSSSPVPFISWNTVAPGDRPWEGSPLSGFTENTYFYFVHSFYATSNDSGNVLAYSNYGDTKFVSVVSKANVLATQFHPEKSAGVGLKLIKSWADLGRLYN